VNYYPHHIGDYAKDTRALTQGEHGAYRLLIDEAYSSENGIDADEIYAISCAHTATERRNTDRVLAKFFTLKDGRYYQKRIDKEVETYREKSAKASASAMRRWSKGNANAMRTHIEGTCEVDAKPMLPITNNQKKENIIPADAGAALWEFGITVLTEQGIKEGSARSFMGSILKKYEEKHVESALRASVGKADAKAYIVAVLNNHPQRGQQMSIV